MPSLLGLFGLGYPPLLIHAPDSWRQGRAEYNIAPILQAEQDDFLKYGEKAKFGQFLP